VVQGRYEGLYGFLAMVSKLKNNEDFRKLVCEAVAWKECMHKIVYYEIGGSSTQVAFTMNANAGAGAEAGNGAVTAPSAASARAKRLFSRFHSRRRGVVELSKGFSDYLDGHARIYSRSFLGNGGNQINDVYLEKSDCLTNMDKSGKERFEICLNDMKNMLDND